MSSSGLRSSVWRALKLFFWKFLKSTFPALRRLIHYGGITHLVLEYKSICCFSNQFFLPQQTSLFWKLRSRFLQLFNPLKLVKFLICNALKLEKTILMTKNVTELQNEINYGLITRTLFPLSKLLKSVISHAHAFRA